MSESARVRHVGALNELGGALTSFADRSLLALESVDAEMRRALDWLDAQVGHWQTEIRKSEEAVFLAKQELGRKKLMRVGDRPPDTSEQEEALYHARERLRRAEDKLEATRNWLRQWDTEMIEYEGPTRQLKSFLEMDISRAGALLKNKTEILESYLATGLPDESAPAAAGPFPSAPAPVAGTGRDQRRDEEKRP
jgi:hypothetical protein